MKLLKIIGTLIIVVLLWLGVFKIVKGMLTYLNANSPFINVILITSAVIGLIVIAYKGIQVIWRT
jgi:hypothetical protein